MTPENSDGPPTHQDGYEWLSTRAANAIDRVTSNDPSDTSALVADDLYLKPIDRTFRQGTDQCLLSALDHLRFLAWSLKNREHPYPYAQATLIRTAITAASTALWMLSGNTADDRRSRAMQFNFSDIRSQLGWLDTVAAEPKNQQRPAAEWTQLNTIRTAQESRLDWIVQEANALLSPQIPYTRRTYKNSITSDTEMVKIAGSSTPALADGGWDSSLVLLNTWQVLSGYAHARPWASSLGTTLTVTDSTPHPVTGTIAITAKGNPDRLLDFAFRAIVVAETAISTMEQLSA